MSDPLFDRPATAAPYRGTGGSSGSATSRTRAEREAQDGTLSRRQASILSLLEKAKWNGHTVIELRDPSPYGLGHHGQVSGALSNMHKAGEIVALDEKFDGGRRGGAGVYVHPDYVAGRATRAFRPNKGNDGLEAKTVVLDEGPWGKNAHADLERQAAIYTDGMKHLLPVPEKKKPALTGAERRLVLRVLEARRGRTGAVMPLQTDTFDALMALIKRLADF